MEKKQRNKTLFCSIILMLAFIVTISSTVAFFAVSKSDNETIVGQTGNIDLGLSVSAITDVTKGLVPIKESDIVKGLKGTNGACIDSRGNTVCQIYKLSLENKGDSTVSVNGEVMITPEVGLKNLRWALLTDDRLSLDGESQEITNISLISNDVINKKNSKDYYITIFNS